MGSEGNEEPNTEHNDALSEACPRTWSFALASVLVSAIVVVLIGTQFTTHATSPIIQYVIRITSCLCTQSRLDDTLSPALRAAVEEHVLRTMQVRQRGEWDFACKSNGGRVALQVTSGYHGLFSSRTNDPSVTIGDQLDPAKCWAMPSLPSQLGIRLPYRVRPTHAYVQHPSNIHAALTQAPQNMTLWGVVEGNANLALYKTLLPEHTPPEHRAPLITKGHQWAPLTTFVYDIHSPSAQTFPIAQQYTGVGMTFGVFALEVHSNWGDSTTCLYKVGIYGTPSV